MHSLLFLVGLILSAPTDSIPTINLGSPPVLPDCYQYRVGWFRPRWRADWLYHRVIVEGDTLCNGLLTSDMPAFVVKMDLPDSADVEFETWVTRFEQLPNGRVVRGPIRVNDVDPEKLQDLHRRDVHRRDRPSVAPTRPRQAPLLPNLSGTTWPGEAGCAYRLFAGQVRVEYAYFTAVLRGDTLTQNFLGPDHEAAISALGYSDSTPFELTVLIESYVLDENGRVFAGPLIDGPMTKARFDQRMANHADRQVHLPPNAPPPSLAQRATAAQ